MLWQVSQKRKKKGLTYHEDVILISDNLIGWNGQSYQQAIDSYGTAKGRDIGKCLLLS